MQPTESFNVPRRALDVEDYIDILRRHKGWIFGPFLLTLVASVVGVYLWPDSYESVAVVKIVPQQVPQNLVQSSITQDMIDRISSMQTTVLSRNVLITIITSHNGLYQKELKRLPMEDVVENIMRKDIHITPIMAGSNGRNVPAFSVQFSYEDRKLTRDVVSDLVGKFTSGDSSNLTTSAIEATEFLKDQRDQAKKKMDSLEENLSNFRVRNAGRLPDQVDRNVQQLTVLQNNYQFLTSSKNRAEMEKLSYETNLRVESGRKDALKRETPQISANSAPVPKSDRTAEIDRDIRRYEDQLAAVRQKFTEAHPDVTTLKGLLEVAKDRKQKIQAEEAEAEAKARAETKTPAVAPVVSAQLQRELLDVDGNIQRLESAIAQKNLEIADLGTQIKQAQDSINKLDGQISSAPLGQKEYDELLRERELARQRYMELDGTLGKAQTSQDLESRGQGEKLELLDAPSLPVNPTEPKRPLVIGIGAGLGLLLGIVIAAAREVKDTSLKNLKDVRAYTQMAILGSVPLLENDFVVRRRRRMAWLGWTTASLVAVVTMAGSVAYYYYRVNL